MIPEQGALPIATTDATSMGELDNRHASRDYGVGTSLSFSQLSTFNDCALKFKLKYLDKVPTVPSGAGFGGTAVHKTIELSETEGWWAEQEPWNAEGIGTETFKNTFVALVQSAGGPDAVRWGGRKSKEYPTGENHLWWLKVGPVMLRRYAAIRLYDEERGWNVLPSEVEFAVGANLPHSGEYVRGYVDQQLLVTEDGEAIVRDWKTGTWLDPLQLPTYAWLIKQMRGIEVTIGQIGYLRGSKAEQWLKTYDLRELTPLVPELYEELNTGRQLAIENEHFPMKPSPMCSGCPVKLHCPYGKTLEVDPK